MVGSGLNRQQLRGICLALGVALTHISLRFIGDTRGHRAGADEPHRQVTELQCHEQHSWYDLVTDSQADDCIEQIVTEPDSRGHCHHITAEQAEIHARLALGNAIAHSRHA